MGEDRETDPFGIVPDGFREAWGAVTIPGALEIAERAPGTNPYASFTRCPDCRSTCIQKKDESFEMETRRPGLFKCRTCNSHFDSPLAPLEDRPIEILWAWFADDQRDPKRMFKTSEGVPDEEIETDFEWCNARALKDPDERTPALSQLDDETLTALAIRAYEPWSDAGPSYREIADVLPYSRWWVGERVRAWKDGEYRDLVADPTAESGPEPDPIHEPDPFDYDRAVATDGGRHRRRWAAYGSY